MKSDNTSKQDLKKRITLKNTFIFILCFIIGFFLMYKICTPFLKGLFFEQNTKKVVKELNRELDQISSTEELQTFLKNQSESEDKDVKAVSVAIGFFMNGDIIRDFCTQTGYIPNKYINLRNSYKTKIDLDEEFIKVTTQKEGLSKDHAVFALKEAKAMLRQQLGRILENEYLLIQQQNPSFTKATYCKMYDEHAAEIISNNLKEIRDNLSDKYQKYFGK